NGPAGLALSAFLSGVLPYYNPNAPHPDPTVDEKLRENLCQSLIDQDLKWCETIEFLGGSSRPLSILYDSLVRPGADVGAQISSRLLWQTDERRQIPHLVLGETAVGGSWNNYDPEMIALSSSSWLDLPGLSISDWLQGTPLISRLSLSLCTLSQYHRRLMTCDEKSSHSHTFLHFKKTGGVWSVSGKRLDGMSFSYTANHVILACGLMKKRPLEVFLTTFIFIIQRYSYVYSVRVVVVGDGITSADAVRVCLEHEVPVLHLMRRTERQIQNSVLSRLSPLHYLEYHSIYRLMIGKDSHPLYVKRHASSIISVDENSEKCSLLVVCIGRVSDFDGILVGKYTFTGYHSEEDPTLMRVGSFAGDNLVRYIVGGCLDVARSLHNLYRNKNSSAM
uniref:Pyr_redox_2 domain-containing protein n=1 Tax=Angiostrongylus cantonensis TaxID=6313 RepID=A0A0K0DCP8_ANGCA